MFKDGKLPNAKQLPTGTIVVLEDEVGAKRKTEEIVSEITQENEND